MQQVSERCMKAQRQLQAKLGQERPLKHGRVQVSPLLISANASKVVIKLEFSARTFLFWYLIIYIILSSTEEIMFYRK